MLTCEQATPLVARMADEALGVDDRAALDRHLSGCARCRAELEDQRAVTAVLRARPPAEAPASLAVRLAAEIALDSAWLGVADWRGWSFRLAPLAAALVLVAVLWGGGVQQAEPAESLASIVETWMMGDRTDGLPATSVFWQADVNADTLLVTVLLSGPDDALATGTQDVTR